MSDIELFERITELMKAINRTNPYTDKERYERYIEQYNDLCDIYFQRRLHEEE